MTTTATPDHTPEEAELLARITTRIHELGAAEEALQAAVDAARDAHLSWADIAPVFGVSRQAVWERFAKTAKGRKTR